MDKKRKWQLVLILAVIGLTVFNILPTLFYYLKPLNNPIDSIRGNELAHSIEERVNGLEKESKEWLASFCDLIQVKPSTISIDPTNPQLVSLQFIKVEDAARFRKFLPRSGSLISFAPSQLSLASQEESGKEVLVQRRIPVRFNSSDSLFSFTAKKMSDGSLTPLYQDLILDRAAQIALSIAGPSESALTLTVLNQHPEIRPDIKRAYLEHLASQINQVSELLDESPSIGARFAVSLTQGHFFKREDAVSSLITAFDQFRDELKADKAQVLDQEKKLKESGAFLGEEDLEKLRILEKKELHLLRAESTLKKHAALFARGEEAWDLEQLHATLKADPSHLLIANRNPLFSHLSIDWEREKIILKLHPDVSALRSQGKNRELLEQLLINEAAKINRLSQETVLPGEGEYSISLHQLPNTSGLLVLDLEQISRLQIRSANALISGRWQPSHPDLQNLPIVDRHTYESMPAAQKAIALIIDAPTSENPIQGLKNNSLYVIAKGLDPLLQNYEQYPDSEQAKAFTSDFRKLAETLQQNGFIGYRGTAFATGGKFDRDFIFEKSEISRPLLMATREDFKVHGTKKFAYLELSDVEQRILTVNRIETRIHEDLLKWHDEYRAAQISLNPALRFDVPKPTRSVFWSNLILSLKKLVRGDERKIIRWGLDLSGGKTVQIELRDANQQPVKNDADLKQGINELYNRVNKMGVSEVSIRQMGHQIVLDFPGSQSLSASELIKASSMYFHIVNEKFSNGNLSLAETANRFLQEIWNEAVVTNRKDAQSINAIAWKHLYGEATDWETPQPPTETARTLLENGLRLQSPSDPSMSNAVNDAVSKIAVIRGNDFSEWHGQSHPLLIVFRNYALEGSQLENVRSNYDPSKGNYLSFEVSGLSLNREGQKINPRNDLHAWTSQFSKERILGTTNEAYSKGRGWRMAVILNETVISAPTLDSALRDSAMISGSFSQREVNQLVSDLKAGSLTFTPHILSEKNVSPELGQSDRIQGITATIAALVLVIAAMVIYYRFAGFVASIAVFFNLLIIWAILQNLGATLSLAGLAGVILNIGMAVDANVLVFERIKEEFAVSGKIGSAIAAGYKKAYSAIIDSNITTIIAALILLNFDAGPIKAFATTLIIGIASSMFTALFMTRFYFTGWVQNPKNKVLRMSSWIHAQKIDFLKWSKAAFALAAAIILVGGFFLYSQRATIFGMDFTGGFSLNLELKETAQQNYIASVEKALQESGASPRDFQIRQLNPPNYLRILFGTSMEQAGSPFYNMPLENDRNEISYTYEKNPRIEWVVNSLEKGEVALASGSLPQLHTNWTAMSGQMSDTMRNNALIGLLISFVAIFIYIAFRFEYKFAAAAILCLMHDVLITLGLMGLLHLVGVPVQIDLNTVAALMTIVGYSLNDTIIIFDRIREEMRLSRKRPLNEIVNAALNSTLSRTTITSGTTLLVLVALVILGGSSIFSFALVMTIGVFFGTLSSWYIASPLMLFFHGREQAKERDLVQQV